MTPNNQIIPIVEDDQGEGYKDPIDLDDLFALYDHPDFQESQKKLFRHLNKQNMATLKRSQGR